MHISMYTARIPYARACNSVLPSFIKSYSVHRGRIYRNSGFPLASRGGDSINSAVDIYDRDRNETRFLVKNTLTSPALLAARKYLLRFNERHFTIQAVFTEQMRSRCVHY